MTSDGYGSQRDPEDKILLNTENAVESLLCQMSIKGLTEVHSPKVNSGLFGVPWEKTEKIITEQLERFSGVNWTVWTQNLS